MMPTQCTAMHNNMRCTNTEGHGGWHRALDVEWFDGMSRTNVEPCRSRVTFEGDVLACQEWHGHRTAHRAANVVWTDPTGGI